MNLKLNIDGKIVNRSYTIASSPTRRDACDLSIKRESNGSASRFLHDTIYVGSTIEGGAPAGKFVFTGSESNEVLLITGGRWNTPLMSMIWFLTDRSWDDDIYFLDVAKSEREFNLSRRANVTAEAISETAPLRNVDAFRSGVGMEELDGLRERCPS